MSCLLLVKHLRNDRNQKLFTKPKHLHMNTTEFLAMQSEYSARTRGAKNVIDASFPLIEQALKDLLSNFKAPYLTLADMGAADGGTSMSLVLNAVKAIRKQHPDLPIHLNYSDLPENDFNALSRLLNNVNGEGDAILDLFEGLTISAAPVSFYYPILPPQTLSLGYSATAMHWLEFAPGKITDHVHIAASKDGQAQELFSQKAHEDLVKILHHRKEEMHTGAYFLLVNFGINEGGQFLGNTRGVHMFNHFYKILSQMVDEGKITKEELLNMNFPQFYRSKEDYRKAVDDPSLKGQLEIVDIKDLTTPCPYREDFENTGDEATFVKTYPETLQTWSYPVFFVGLDKSRPEEERHGLVTEFFERYKADIKASPEEHGMDYVHHLVLLKRV